MELALKVHREHTDAPAENAENAETPFETIFRNNCNFRTAIDSDSGATVISFHDCVQRLLKPGQIPINHTFEKATVIWLAESRKRRGQT
jgi:hypothetical protein